MANVRVIEPTIDPLTGMDLESPSLRKVAAYARVSTDTDEQYTSYEAQVNYYRGYIQSRPDWEFAGVYADEGISGTSTKNREGFNKMVDAALKGEINLIVTKSISRFARNTLDTITYIRRLKASGVEVFFEKENLWTFDSKSEMVLSMLAAIAQEESRSISENVKMGKRWGYREGKVSIPYSSFIGYEKKDGKIAINEEEAKVVRLIYSLYLRDGMSMGAIARKLNADGVPMAKGRSGEWRMARIAAILRNEKYKGDALLQKVYVPSYLDHAVKRNDGVLPQYYVENSHPGIIPREEWDAVQEEIKRRGAKGSPQSPSNPFAGKLVCSCCGRPYGPKVWHSNTSHRKVILQCTAKFAKGKKKCSTPNLSEEEVRARFVKAYNTAMGDRGDAIRDVKSAIKALTDVSGDDQRIAALESELGEIRTLAEALVAENKSKAQSQEEYAAKYQSLAERFDAKKAELEGAREERSAKISKGEAARNFLRELEGSPSDLDAFDPALWNVMLESAAVNGDGTIAFRFKSGAEIVL